MAQTLKRLAGKVKATVKYGARLDWEKQDEWQRNANGFTVTLRYRGRQYTVDFWQGNGISGEPTAETVLECLLSDASGVVNASDFEQWCGEYGFDSDSRKAERTYDACAKCKDELRRLLGDDFAAFLYAERD